MRVLHFTLKLPSAGHRNRPRSTTNLPTPSHPPTSKVLQRWARGESGRWKMSLEAVVSNLHVGGSGHSTSCAMVALLSNPEATTTLDSTLSDQAALFRESTACSTWRGAVEKVRLNKARLHSTQLASRGQWVIFIAVETIRNQSKASRT